MAEAATKLKVVEARKVDDAVRERHGCACRDASDNTAASVTVWESEQSIFLNRYSYDRALTPWQARYLASKLYRLSRRIRQRSTQAQA
jgi:hypothetical protein